MTATGTLSPAPGTAERLEKLTSSTGAIFESFNAILKLPYVDALRVDDLGTLSVHDAILDLRSKYQQLQADTLPFARDLYGYAGLQISTIPLINNGGLSLHNYILMNKSIIVRKKATATQVKGKSEAFRKEFSAKLDILENSLRELDAQISSLESSISTTQDAYDAAKASAIIAGILTAAFTAAFVFGMVASAGALAVAGGATATGTAATFGASLAAAGGMSGLVGSTVAAGSGAVAALTTTIIKSIESGNLLEAINAMKAVKSSAETSKTQLSEVISKMLSIETSIEDIVSVWTSVEQSLDIILNDITSWQSGLFSAEVAQATVLEWTEVRTSVEKYTNIVSSERSLQTQAAPKKLPSLTAEVVARGIADLALADMKESILAPEVDFQGKLADLSEAKSALGDLQRLAEGDSTLKSQTNDAYSNLKLARKDMLRASGRLETMSRESRTVFAKILKEKDASIAAPKLRAAFNERIQSINSSHDAITQEAAAAEQAAFAFQRTIGVVNNTLARRARERNAEISALRKRLRDVEKDRQNRKWLWIVPIAGAINELVDLANDIQGKINKLRRQIRDTERVRGSLLNASKTVGGVVKDSTHVVQTFSSILNGNAAIESSLDVIEALKLDTPRVIFQNAESSWAELAEDVEEFLS